MRLAVITPVWPPYNSGQGQVAYEQAKELARQGEQVTVFTPAYPGRALEQPSRVNVVGLRSLFRHGNAAFTPQLASRLKGFDLAYLHYPNFWAAETVVGARRFGARWPLVMHYHMDLVGQGLLGWYFRYHTRYVFPRLLRQVDFLISASFDYLAGSAAGDWLRQHPKQVAEIPFGVESEFRPSEKFKSPKSFSGSLEALPDSPLIEGGLGGFASDHAAPIKLLFIGGLDQAHWFKGLRVLLEALSGLPAINWALTVVGDGELRPRYEQQARQLGIALRVRFAGSIARQEVVEACQGHDLLVLPSTGRSEAFGLVLAEMMACGHPVIASDLPGVRGVLRPGVTGWLVKPGDAESLRLTLAEALTDPARLAQMGEQAARLAGERYRWPRHVEALRTIFRKLV